MTEVLKPSPEMQQHAKDLKDHATEGAQNVKKDVQNLAGDVKDHARKGYRAVKDEAADQVDAARDRAGDLLENVRSYASEHPVSTFGFGVLAGIILATWRRR
jgi:ElaB/YqjD/DUF883 family membrane-anchored ribosome-binding protein